MAIGSNPSAGDSQSFSYTGGIQSFTIPANGIYKLEVWGAKGGSTNGGKGGHSVGYKGLMKGTTLYIVCGGRGDTGTYGGSGGYNGGGAGKSAESEAVAYAYGGGGATHIATVSGQLKNLSTYKNTGEILIVAGGGGGGCTGDSSAYGGTGGGASGGNGTGAYTAAGGTQTSAGANGGFGYGGACDYTVNGSGGGGGGWYGGAFGPTTVTGGGGGSGCIIFSPTIKIGSTTYQSSMTNGVNDSTGKATITYMAPAELYTITYNLNSGTQGSGAVTSYTIDTATFNLPTPTRDNYIFNGWYETSDFSTAQVTQVIKGSVGDKTFYAKWFGPLKYTYSYAAKVYEFTCPFNGIWKLECYGAQGTNSGGKGGYSIGYKALKTGDKLYICVGHSGTSWNGGGKGYKAGEDKVHVGDGGGCTHIATVSGQLKNLSAYKNTGEILIVAGGGGGYCWKDGAASSHGGGTGGGTSGGGGTGGGFGYGGSFGQAHANGCAGGGAGWKGGGYYGNGGTGWIGNVPTFTVRGTQYSSSTTNGQRSGNGVAYITWVAPSVLFDFVDTDGKKTEITELIYNGTNITNFNFNGTKIF